MKRLLTIILLGSCATTTAFATTYVRVEKDGTKTYSDRPLPGGQPVEIQSAQTYSAAQAAPAAQSAVPREQQLLNEMGEPFRYESCALKPDPDQTFTNPELVSVSVSLTPALRAGDVVDLRLDGATVGGANALSYVMKPVARGTHSVSVTVKDRYGRPACSASASFHVHQPSVNSPARNQPATTPKPQPLPRPKGG
jgi:hypothetical protein